MKKAYPDHKGKWTIIEDNDPSGYKCAKGCAAKKEANIVTDDLPKRSPDLNVLDYSLWNEVNKRMRLQERAFRKTKKETTAEFKARLRKTALGVPTAVVEKAVGSMARRCKAIFDAKGDLFNE